MEDVFSYLSFSCSSILSAVTIYPPSLRGKESLESVFVKEIGQSQILGS